MGWRWKGGKILPLRGRTLQQDDHLSCPAVGERTGQRRTRRYQAWNDCCERNAPLMVPIMTYDDASEEIKDSRASLIEALMSTCVFKIVIKYDEAERINLDEVHDSRNWEKHKGNLHSSLFLIGSVFSSCYVGYISTCSKLFLHITFNIYLCITYFHCYTFLNLTRCIMSTSLDSVDESLPQVEVNIQ